MDSLKVKLDEGTPCICVFLRLSEKDSFLKKYVRLHCNNYYRTNFQGTQVKKANGII